MLALKPPKYYAITLSIKVQASTKNPLSHYLSQAKVQMRFLRILFAYSSFNLKTFELKRNYLSLLHSTYNDEAGIYLNTLIRNHREGDVNRSHWPIAILKLSQFHIISSFIRYQSSSFGMVFYGFGFTFWHLVLTPSNALLFN